MLAAATSADGAPVVVTSHGLWLPEPDGATRRVGWHLVSKATWQQGTLTVIEADELDVVEGAVLIADRPPRRLRLADPGRVPETVHARVEGSIRSRHHRALPGGGAWFVQRKVPGRDGVRAAGAGRARAPTTRRVRRLVAAVAAGVGRVEP